MKKLIVVLVVATMFSASMVYGAITSTEAEMKVGSHLKTIHATVESAKEDVTRVYNDIKAYVADYAVQFLAPDKKALNNLQSDMLDLNSAMLKVLTNIEDNFPGLIE